MTMHFKKFAFLVIILAAESSRAFSMPQATNTGSSLGLQANAAFEAKDWANSAKLYEQIVQDTPNPRAWYRLGVSLSKTGQGEKAIAVFEAGIKAGLPPQTGEYGIAAVYGAKKDREKAFEYLQRAIEHGLNMPEQLAGDEDLADLKGDPRFAKILERATKNQKPCAYQAENRQFDFWVGEWEVVTTNSDTPAGRSRIELILGDCVVQENWQSLGNPYSGKSYNIYNATLKRWEQYWVDNAGEDIFFFGGLKDGVMDYWTDEIPQSDGSKLKRHLQFVPMGPETVRQWSQGSKDGGKSWQVEYDLTYHRKK